ncbi:hypothetical protein J3R82DRAFT_10203 [Butyriboletus roseoflavus]|nr:hypothetical protein J3R82DRAFT_10203 [Butyriboletus roseoflavus]
MTNLTKDCPPSTISQVSTEPTIDHPALDQVRLTDRRDVSEVKTLASLQVIHVHPPKKARVSESEPLALPRAEDETEVAQRKIELLEAELAHVKAAKMAKSKSPLSDAEPSRLRSHDAASPADLHVSGILQTEPSVSVRTKGASLANPHKKARKYQTVEFESDND